MTNRRIIQIASRALPLCALLLASCGTSSGGTGTGGSGQGTAGTSGGGGTSGAAGTTGASGNSGSSGTTGSGGTGATGTGGSIATGTGGSAAGTGGSAGGTTGAGGSAGTTGAGGSAGAAGRGGTVGTGGAAGRGGTVGTGGATAGAGGTTAGTGGGTGGVVACGAPNITLPSGSNAVFGSMITFNDNGGWCWYQDERAVVDTKANKLVIATEASGGTRNGQTEAVIYDIAMNKSTRYTLTSSLSTNNVDDHNSPALLIRPDGQYFAMWSSHRIDCLSRTSIFNGTSWSAEKTIDWTPWGCPWGPSGTTNLVTYSNPWYIGSTIISMERSVGTDPAVLSSTDNGANFTYYGRLMDTAQVGYVAGYFKYWGNNTDRIDFVGTEAHPRDFDTSLYHGYISGGKVYNSMGAVKDSSLMDASSTTTNSVDINTYTPVLKTGSMVNGMQICRMWDHDIVRYADGTIAVLGQGRVGAPNSTNCNSTPSDPDKRMLYFRFDGTSWKATYLVKGGPKLYPAEEDYIGLGALDPDDPHAIYISTPYDPRDDTTMPSSGKREIWRGTTCDNGATFQWTQLTARSTMDNIRPIVPKWDSSHTALLWLRGTYTSAQQYALQVVGNVGAKQ
ncbi:MAG TPA: hypothetical protein VKQ32_10110 [Polyangia bacterium]|nr:hypothetical protein [Polyangia bacterium]